MAEIVEGPMISALSCGKPVFLVVLLHGPGENGQSIIDHALNWAPTIIKADFLAVEAPFQRGGDGRYWFEAEDDSPEAINAGLAALAHDFDRFLDEALARRRLPDSHLALVGFSHGAMLALHVGLRRAKPLACILAFSGALHDNEALVRELGAPTPVLFIHGDEDPVIPIEAMRATRNALKPFNVPTKALRRPGLGHAMDDDGVVVAGDFLTEHVAHRPAPGATPIQEHDHDRQDDHEHR
jgi:phospholipase/carboxylesterase